MRDQQNLWGVERMSLERSIELTIESLQTYGPLYKHWSIAYSGGKDSSATVVLIAYLITTGKIPAPESLTVFYADTRMELPPLQAAAMTILGEVEQRGIRTQVVLPPLDERFFVYMFGRGVPAPKSRFRWCTPQLKVEPMNRALEAYAVSLGHGEMVWSEQYQKLVYHPYGEMVKVWDKEAGKEKEVFQPDHKCLMLTGVRIGESAARDQRIALSCSKDGAECGQGWFQTSTPESIADTLAPLLHWRVCHVWDWLLGLVPGEYDHGFSTSLIAEVYGGDEAAEIQARTGCVGCNLATKDTALDNLLLLPQWAYLAPLKRLRPLYQELVKPQYRLRQSGERRKDGSLSAHPMRMGPYTLETRRYGLDYVLSIQDEINQAAHLSGRPTIDLINTEEYARILELIEANTWPNGWTGEEVHADVLIPQILAGDMVQPLLTEVV